MDAPTNKYLSVRKHKVVFIRDDCAPSFNNASTQMFICGDARRARLHGAPRCVLAATADAPTNKHLSARNVK
ncbi:hypothetical protein IJJ05_01970 [Candidatus Saccharibacteria bacterium]|nr:hypothetical protein [Candidatus Saccharibacteria bacterium]